MWPSLYQHIRSEHIHMNSVYHPQHPKGGKLRRARLIIAKSTLHNSKNWLHKRSNWFSSLLSPFSPWLYGRGWTAETTSFPSDIHSLHTLPLDRRDVILYTINHFRTHRCCRIRIVTGDCTFHLRKELHPPAIKFADRRQKCCSSHSAPTFCRLSVAEHEAHWKPFSWILLGLFTFPLTRKMN